MNAFRSLSLRAKPDLLLSAVLLFALGVATGQVGQAQPAKPSMQSMQPAQPAQTLRVRPMAADLPTVRHGELQLTPRQRWVF